MIKALINGVFNLVGGLVTFILDNTLGPLIQKLLPSLDSGLSTIGGFFNILSEYSSWVLSYTGITESNLTFLKGALVFIIMVPIVVNTIKLALTWYDVLKV